MTQRFVALLMFLVAGTAASRATRAADRQPFSGWLKAELEHDSVWFNCKVSVFVDERGRGLTEGECGTPEGLRTAHSNEAVSDRDIEELRRLLRGADLFQGQFWGHDLRGIDAMLATLTVSDGSKVARVVCFKNESFEG